MGKLSMMMDHISVVKFNSNLILPIVGCLVEWPKVCVESCGLPRVMAMCLIGCNEVQL